MNRKGAIGYILAAVFAAGFAYEAVKANKLESILENDVQQLRNKVQTIEQAPDTPKKDSFMGTTAPQITEEEPEAVVINASAEFKLEGRTVETKALPESSLAGVVVVGISVDRNGNVVKTTIGATSTIKDKEILESARNAAMQTRFNPTEDGAEKTVGNITYTFTQD